MPISRYISITLLLHITAAHPSDPPLTGRLSWNGSHLVLNGKPYAGVGLNIVNLALWGGNIKALEDAAHYGVPFVRFAAAPYWGDELQQWQSDPENYWSNLDVVVTQAENLRIRLVPDLLWNPFAFADFCHEPLAELYGNTSSCTRQTVVRYVTQIVQRYADSPAILFWELSNENNALVDGFMNGSKVACDPARGTPPHRTDRDNFDTAQMLQTFGWLSSIIRRTDASRLINAGTSMPRPFAQSWRNTPRSQVARHHMNSTLDSRADFLRNLLDTNSQTDFVSAHMGGHPDNAKRAWLRNVTDPVLLLETARTAAAHNMQPLYLGEFTITIDEDGNRTYAYADFIMDWLLKVHERLSGGGGVIASMWVFEYQPQSATLSIEPSRDAELLSKLAAVNKKLGATTGLSQKFPPPPSPAPECSSVDRRDWGIKLEDTGLPWARGSYSVRQTNCVFLEARYWCFADVVPYSNPHYPNTYNTSTHLFSASASDMIFHYEHEVIPRGAPGTWDHGGAQTPGAAIAADGTVVVVYCGFAHGNTSRDSSIGVATANHPNGTFTKRGRIPATIEPGRNHADPQLVLDPYSGQLVLWHRRSGGPEGYVMIRSQQNQSVGAEWTDFIKAAVVLAADPAPGPGVRAREPMDAKFLPTRNQTLLISDEFWWPPVSPSVCDAVFVSSNANATKAVLCPTKTPVLGIPNPYLEQVTLLQNGQGTIEYVLLGQKDSVGKGYGPVVYRLRDGL